MAVIYLNFSVILYRYTAKYAFTYMDYLNLRRVMRQLFNIEVLLYTITFVGHVEDEAPGCLADEA